eukprot:CAMPEP_0173442140 /NCGR_PEP_ID=MMETSP1357-20121228/25574_1 /TAXON_ID=77926 /ORGANISM="Hemiselmis rufescens, Strain PCC563" /LENGTH=77 /DNA_ID=CAMNT_0014407817 /DNA_START=1 /DNA_END=231 /DNA_ORIENTATION=+
MFFNVTDLNSDIVVQVCCMNTVGGFDVESKIIGQAIIPFSRLLPKLVSSPGIPSSVHGIPAVQPGVCTRTVTICEWL